MIVEFCQSDNGEKLKSSFQYELTLESYLLRINGYEWYF